MTKKQEKFFNENYQEIYEIFEKRYPELIHSDFYLDDEIDLVVEIIKELMEEKNEF